LLQTKENNVDKIVMVADVFGDTLGVALRKASAMTANIRLGWKRPSFTNVVATLNKVLK
jgi:hypothetical protein